MVRTQRTRGEEKVYDWGHVMNLALIAADASVGAHFRGASPPGCDDDDGAGGGRGGGSVGALRHMPPTMGINRA